MRLQGSTHAGHGCDRLPGPLRRAAAARVRRCCRVRRLSLALFPNVPQSHHAKSASSGILYSFMPHHAVTCAALCLRLCRTMPSLCHISPATSFALPYRVCHTVDPKPCKCMNAFQVCKSLHHEQLYVMYTDTSIRSAYAQRVHMFVSGYIRRRELPRASSDVPALYAVMRITCML